MRAVDFEPPSRIGGVTSKHSPYGRGSRAKVCRGCGGHESEVGRMSARALCTLCGGTRATEAAEQIAAGVGPHYEQWRRGIIEHAHRLATR